MPLKNATAGDTVELAHWPEHLGQTQRTSSQPSLHAGCALSSSSIHRRNDRVSSVCPPIRTHTRTHAQTPTRRLHTLDISSPHCSRCSAPFLPPRVPVPGHLSTARHRRNAQSPASPLLAPADTQQQDWKSGFHIWASGRATPWVPLLMSPLRPTTMPTQHSQHSTTTLASTMTPTTTSTMTTACWLVAV
jgi:hypothetical protein